MKKVFDTVIVSETGRPLQNVVIVVKQGGSAVTIYSDETPTPIDVLRTDADGYFEFFAPDGVYTIEYQYGGGTFRTVDDVQIFDLTSVSGGDSLTAAETLTAGQLVNIFNSSGAKMRVATNTVVGKPADGFVVAPVASAAIGRFSGPGSIITGLSGLTPGDRYYLDAAGAITPTPPTAEGLVVQEVGVALSSTRLLFNPKEDHPL